VIRKEKCMIQTTRQLFLLLYIFAFCGSVGWGAIPQISIKVGEFAREIRFLCPQGGQWQLGDKKGSLKPGVLYTLSGTMQRPAQITRHVMVESVPMRETERVAATLQKWQATGRSVHTLMVGKATLGPDQKTVSYDGRVMFFGVGKFDTPEPAQKLVDELAAQGTSSYVLEETQALAQGSLTLREGKKTCVSGTSALRVSTPGLIDVKKVEHAKGYAWHGFADRRYRGILSMQWGARDALDVILKTDLEALIAGVVPSEISAKAALGALQAQAVAARGEMLSKVGLRHLKEGFDFCAQQHCQVFSGETPDSVRIANEIRPTLGVLMRDAKGAIVDAVYAANCGGHSEANHLVWTSTPSPQLAGIWDCQTPPTLDLTKEADVRKFVAQTTGFHCADPTVEGGDKFRWVKEISGKEWQAVEERAQIGRLREIQLHERGFSGRLGRISLVGEQGTKTILKELPIRRLFGGLRSACFVAEWHQSPQGFITGAVFRGAGWGHGVGMCQTGAQYLAKTGWDYQRILAHYFPQSLFVTVYRP
jgi:SpoIID/LytB domain protein